MTRPVWLSQTCSTIQVDNTSRASPLERAAIWAASKMNGRRLHSTQLGQDIELTARRTYVHASRDLCALPSNNFKMATLCWCGLRHHKLFSFVSYHQYWRKYQKALTQKQAITVACLSCFNSFLRPLSAWIKRKKEEKCAVFQIIMSISYFVHVYRQVMMFSGSISGIRFEFWDGYLSHP